MRFLGRSWEQVGSWFQLTGETGLKIFGIDATVYNPYGIDLKNNQFVLVGNHRSWFDQVAITAKMPKPFHILAHEKYFKMPTLGYALRTWQGIPVRNKKISEQDLQRIHNYLQRKENMFFFIEGTRGKGKELLPFRLGAFKIAAQSKVPVLPLYIFGAEDCLHKSNSLLSVKPGKIDIIVGSPVMFNLQDLGEQVQNFRQKYKSVHDKMYDAFYKSSFEEQRQNEISSADLIQSRGYESIYGHFLFDFNPSSGQGL